MEFTEEELQLRDAVNYANGWLEGFMDCLAEKKRLELEGELWKATEHLIQGRPA